MNKGDVVMYTMEFDSDLNDEIPNVGPAMITKIVDELSGVATSVDLIVFFQNGSFSKTNVKPGNVGERGTWHLGDAT